MAKATFWSVTDADVRKRGDQTGLDTLVVHAVNDEDEVSGSKALRCRRKRSKYSTWGVRSQE